MSQPVDLSIYDDEIRAEIEKLPKRLQKKALKRYEKLRGGKMLQAAYKTAEKLAKNKE